MANPNYKKESKKHCLRGLLLLLLGSGLLLVCKMPAAELIGDIAAIIGAGVLLGGNFYIIYGLIIFAGETDNTD